MIRNHACILGDLTQVHQVAGHKQSSYHGQHRQDKTADGHSAVCQAHSNKNGGIGRQKALGNMTEIGGNRGLLRGGQIIPHAVSDNRAADQNCTGSRKASQQEWRDGSVDAAVVEQPVQRHLTVVQILPLFQHPLKEGNRVKDQERLNGGPTGRSLDHSGAGGGYRQTVDQDGDNCGGQYRNGYWFFQPHDQNDNAENDEQL